jgi:hypothetical protein
LFNSNGVLRTLSRIVDRSSINPSFKDTGIKFNPPSTFLSQTPAVHLNLTTKWENGANKVIVQRPPIGSWRDLVGATLYYKPEGVKHGHVKDRYLIDLNKNASVVIISEPSYEKFEEVYESLTTKSKSKEKWLNDIYGRAKMFYDLAIERGALNYDEIVIPDDWNKKIEEEEASFESSTFQNTLSPKEKRELTNMTLVHSLEYFPNVYNRKSVTVKNLKGEQEFVTNYFTLKKREMAPVELTTYDGVLYYGFEEDYDMLQVAALILSKKYYDGKSMYQSFNTWDDVKGKNLPAIIKVNKGMNTFLDRAGHKHISEFFYTEGPNGEATMSKEMIEIITCYKMHKSGYANLNFLRRFKDINPDAAELYDKISKYYNVYANTREFSNHQLMEIGLKLADFQLFLEEHQDDSLIAEKSKELFKVTDYGKTLGIDLDIWNTFTKLVEYSEGIYVMMNALSSSTFSKEEEEAILEYLSLKNKNNFKF